MRDIPDASAENIHPFICDVVGRSATVMADGWKGSNGLSKKKYKHNRIVLSSSKILLTLLCLVSIGLHASLSAGFLVLIRAFYPCTPTVIFGGVYFPI